jgi:hypothetical protein
MHRESAEQQRANYRGMECSVHLSFGSSEALQVLYAESSKKRR